jgi:hypothetical protein
LDLRRRVLESIASVAFDANRTIFYLESLIDILRSALSVDNCQNILNEINISSGLLSKDWYGKWHFSHLIFQEFFTARHRWRLEYNGKDQTEWFNKSTSKQLYKRYKNVVDFYTQLMERE